MFTVEKLKFKEILNIDQLTIADGVVCIVGESGGGKTTLLRHLNNLYTCDEGDVSYNGRNVLEYDPIDLRREVVMLQQSPVMYPGDIRENLLAGTKFARIKDPSDEEMKMALATACLDKPLDENADRLSGGEKQRVAIARVLLISPKVILLDEPTSALDEDTALKVMDSIIGYCREHGISLVIVTHSKALANKYAQQLIEVNSGRAAVKEVGTI